MTLVDSSDIEVLCTYHGAPILNGKYKNLRDALAGVRLTMDMYRFDPEFVEQVVTAVAVKYMEPEPMYVHFGNSVWHTFVYETTTAGRWPWQRDVKALMN